MSVDFRTLADSLKKVYSKKLITVAVKSTTDKVKFEKYYNDPVGFVKYALGRTLTDDQAAILLSLPGRTKVNSGHSVGKAQRCDMDIETPIGKRKFGDLRVGDFVFGVDGKPIQVTAIHPQGIKKQYKITFDDHSTTHACGEHLWAARNRNDRRQSKGFRTISTETILQEGVWRSNGKAKARQWDIPCHKAVEFPSQDVVIGPYTMGAYLGDGCTTHAVIYSMDDEVIESIYDENEDMLRIAYTSETNKAKKITVYGLIQKMKEAGYHGVKTDQKQVPKEYLYNSIEVRLAVLQGLMDTDGTADPRGVSTFTSTSKGLVEDVMWLVRSLGGKAHLFPTPKQGKYKGKDGEYVICKMAYTCNLKLPDYPLFRLTRKMERVKGQTRSGWIERYIENIEPDGEAEMMCISVDSPNGLYLCNDFIVTHNTFVCACAVWWWFCTRNPGVVITTAPTQRDVIDLLWTEVRLLHSGAIVKLPDYFVGPKAPELFHNEEHWAKGYTASRGESLDANTIIDTPNGKVRFGDIKVDDFVFGVDGNPTKVKGVYHNGERPAFKVSFANGTSVIADAKHIWSVINPNSGIRGKQGEKYGYKKEEFKLLTTEEIINKGVTFQHSGHARNKFYIPSCSAVEYPYKDLLIPAYTMGVWLGDGTCFNGGITSADVEMFEYLTKDNPDVLVTSRTMRRCTGGEELNAKDLRIRGIRGKLRDMGLLGGQTEEKRVPKIYMENSIEVRLAVLQGLMDTDGWAESNGSCVFCSSSEGLIDDVMWLVRSLGGRASKNNRIARKKLDETDGVVRYAKPMYRANVCLKSYPLFKLERKQNRVKHSDRRIGIESIEECGTADMVCITVEAEDGLFLANDFIVTHNSFQGRHRNRMLFLFDECEAVDPLYWLTTNTMYQPDQGHGWIAIGNPVSTSSQSYLEDMLTGPDGNPKWKLFTLSALNHPNIKAELHGESPPYPNAVTLGMVEQWVKDWTTPLDRPEDKQATDIEWPPKVECPSCKGEKCEHRVSADSDVSGRENSHSVTGGVRRSTNVGETSDEGRRLGDDISVRVEYAEGTIAQKGDRSEVVRLEETQTTNGEINGNDLEFNGSVSGTGDDVGELRNQERRDETSGNSSMEQGVGLRSGDKDTATSNGERHTPTTTDDNVSNPIRDCTRCNGVGTVGGGKWIRPGPSFKARVMGIRPTEGVDTVFSGAAWELACQRRWGEQDCWHRNFGITIGVDAAAYGDDSSVFHVRSGPVSLYHESRNGWGPDKCAGRIKELCREYADIYNSWAQEDRPKFTAYDVNVILEWDGGYGVGIYSHKQEFRKWWGFTAGAGSDKLNPHGKPLYANCRAQAWLETATNMAGGLVDVSRLPSEVKDRLRLQLLAPFYEIRPDGSRLVEPKKDVKSRLGRSPDDADGLIISHFQPLNYNVSVVMKA